MWAVTGKCLMDWANNWQEILDPLNVSNSVKHISSVWDRLGFCLDEVAKITRQVRVGGDDDGNPESDILQAKAALCAELSRLNDKLRVQRANIETRLAIRGNLLDAGFVMAETVPQLLNCLSFSGCMVCRRLSRNVSCCGAGRQLL
jgi:hypothetical protein